MVYHLKFQTISILLLLIFCKQSASGQCFVCKNAPEGTIWCDDFEDNIPLSQKYFEYNNNSGDFIRLDKVGRDQTYGMRVKWQKGEVSAGSLSKSFGKTPDSYIGKNAARPGEHFDEIYWRMDVMSQDGWKGGGPAKLSRALCLANSNWAQGMMAHLWSGGTNDLYLGMDPASGIGLDGKLKSTKYNDFNNLRWLGFKSGTTPIYNTINSGIWFCIVGHVKLNSPGQKDGIFEFWINDTLQASSKNLDWHSTWNQDSTNMHINAIFFENYWNSGSPVDQERYFDNLVISTKPIPCICNTTKTEEKQNNTLLKIYPNPGQNKIKLDIPEVHLPTTGVVFDQNNKIVLELTIQTSKEPIELNNLHPGIYILKIAKMKPIKLVILK
ncbi:MAG: T9SS type A sorting domain-containing protein [Saprospiraceae bacterium]|nr:T9SS type A sorting domain-containing protein [Saprospiraceae bacterium]MBK9721775.1 T9SS type A sorting domain-containing protein [Saprospiraceae bacterium]